jgi:hypothetical protein
MIEEHLAENGAGRNCLAPNEKGALPDALPMPVKAFYEFAPPVMEVTPRRFCA